MRLARGRAGAAIVGCLLLGLAGPAGAQMADAQAARPVPRPAPDAAAAPQGGAEAGQSGGASALRVAPAGTTAPADPLAQAMILTAIVISMAMTGFILTLAYRQYRYRSADVIEDDTEDTAIAAIASRPGNAAAAPDHDASSDPSTGRATKAGDKFGPEFFEAPVKEANDD